MNSACAELLDRSTLTLDTVSPVPSSSFSTPHELEEWSIIIPFFNEEAFIARCLSGVAAQTLPFRLILVDNGSTDSSAEIARRQCARLGMKYCLLREPERGKVHALATGLNEVSTRFVATFDADTVYPPQYLAAATRLLERSGCVGGQAYYTRKNWRPWQTLIAAAKLHVASRILPHQCHNGGAGQVFRTEALRLCGGFDASRWDVVLEDHEIIHRLSQFGRVVPGWDFWCSPSRREQDLPHTRWSLLERLAYHLTPAQLQSRFLYDFLRPRLEARRSDARG